MTFRDVQRRAAGVVTEFEPHVRQDDDTDVGDQLGMVGVVQTAVCRCSEAEAAAIRERFLRRIPERAEFISAKILDAGSQRA